MDIKWKNSRKAGIVITAGFLLVLAVINFLCYPGINRRSKDWMQKTEAAKTGADSDTQIRTQFLKNLYEGFYLLDLEYQNQKSETEMSATDLYIASYAKADETDRWESQEQLEQVTNDEVLSVMDEWSSQFEKIRSQIDYCVMESEDGSKLKNTTQNLESVLGGEEKDVSEQLAQYYSELFAVKFNEVGAMEVIPLLSDRENSGDLLVKSLGAQERSELLKTNLEEYFNPTDMPVLKGPENIEFVIGISKEKASENILYDSGSDEEEDYFEKLSAYKINGALPLYGASVVAVIAFMFFMTGKKAGGNILNDGKVHAYAAELGVTGVICGLCLQNYFMELIWSYGFDSFSDAADELSMQYREVLVDEYQDSNLVQEELLKAVSRERFGQHNVFMVGDVKQSIYRFRLARPELFLEKYHAYPSEPEEDGPDLKIELHQNFRSRDTVLMGRHGISPETAPVWPEGIYKEIQVYRWQ